MRRDQGPNCNIEEILEVSQTMDGGLGLICRQKGKEEHFWTRPDWTDDYACIL